MLQLPPIINAKLTEAVLSEKSLNILSELIVKALNSMFCVPEGDYLTFLKRDFKDKITKHFQDTSSAAVKFNMASYIKKMVDEIINEFFNSTKNEVLMGKMVSKKLLSPLFIPENTLFWLI